MIGRPQSETGEDRPPARYEFRVWGNDLTTLFAGLCDAGDRAGTEESHETYVVSRIASPFNLKIRAGLLDVKKLIETNERLELWRPYLKAQFPLTLRLLRDDVCHILGLARQGCWGPIDTPERFLREIVEPCPHLALVPVRKTRHRFHFESCLAEFATVEAGDAELETVALESEDAAAVHRAIARLDLGGLENFNYQRALRTMLAFDTMAHAHCPT